MNKTAASAVQLAELRVHFASCLLMYINCSSQLCENKWNFIAYLTSWHNSIFGYKLRTIEAENL